MFDELEVYRRNMVINDVHKEPYKDVALRTIVVLIVKDWTLKIRVSFFIKQQPAYGHSLGHVG